MSHNFYYPDLVVSCQSGEPGNTVVTEPLLVIEVLSESTEARDRNEKRIAYQRLTSLQEYVLVTQVSEEDWEAEIYEAGGQVRLTSVALELEIGAVYGGL